MGEAGLFADERVELLGGTIVSMSPQTSQHAGTVHRLHRALVRAVGAAATVRMQSPIILDDWSEPEPDVAVCALDPYEYTREHPRASALLLVAEVAGSSLAYDRGRKAAAYAASGIAEYWIVDLEARTVEVRSDPDPGTAHYRSVTLVREGDVLPAPGGGAVAVAEVLPPR
jgi:Uma2 family endonuclease